MIPNIRHFAWLAPGFKDREIGDRYQFFLDSFKEHNPDMQIIIWSAEEVRELIKKHGFEDLVKDFHYFIQCMDLFRYLAVYDYGGIWSDADIECLKNLSPILNTSNFVCGYQDRIKRTICNAFFACPPNHPVLGEVIEALPKAWAEVKEKKAKKMSGWHKKETVVMHSTSPNFFTKVLKPDRKERNFGIDYYPYKAFFPFSWKYGETQNYPPKETYEKDAYVVHYWDKNWKDH